MKNDEIVECAVLFTSSYNFKCVVKNIKFNVYYKYIHSWSKNEISHIKWKLPGGNISYGSSMLVYFFN